jgi:hypothetical protein
LQDALVRQRGAAISNQKAQQVELLRRESDLLSTVTRRALMRISTLPKRRVSTPPGEFGDRRIVARIRARRTSMLKGLVT